VQQRRRSVTIRTAPPNPRLRGRASLAGNWTAHRLAVGGRYLPNSPPKTRSELRAWVAEFLRTSAVEWLRYEEGATAVSGDPAVHEYSYVWRVTPRGGGRPVLARGKGIEVLHEESGAGQE
jgi:hypothetical protein